MANIGTHGEHLFNQIRGSLVLTVLIGLYKVAQLQPKSLSLWSANSDLRTTPGQICSLCAWADGVEEAVSVLMAWMLQHRHRKEAQGVAATSMLARSKTCVQIVSQTGSISTGAQ